MLQIDYFFATISPFCYLMGDRLEAIAAKHGASIRYIPLDGPALFPRTGGKVLAERHESRKEYRVQELRRWSQRLGMKLDLQPLFFPVNPAPSSYAVLAAIKAGGGDLAESDRPAGDGGAGCWRRLFCGLPSQVAPGALVALVVDGGDHPVNPGD